MMTMMINYIELRQKVNGIYDCLPMNKCLRAYLVDNIQKKKGGRSAYILFRLENGME